MLFSRAWFALMRRNMIYRRRHWISTIMEIILPVCFVGILLAIKNAFEDAWNLRGEIVPAITPTDMFVFQPFTFADYVTAMQAERRCVIDSDSQFSITGISWEKSWWVDWRWTNWQVPFVKCDSSLCEYEGQNAVPFCEYGSIALSASRWDDTGGRDRALDFREWLYDQYPVLGSGREHLPFDFEFVRIFESNQDMDDYVKRKDYGKDGNPKIVMGIVWEGNDPKEYIYSIRQNSTNYNSPEAANTPETTGVLEWTTPDTSRLLHSFARDDSDACVQDGPVPIQGHLQYSCTGQYVYNGVLTVQRLVGDYILNRTGAEAKGYSVAEAGAKFVQFPTRSYKPSGFFSIVEETSPILVTLGLLYPVASMIGYIAREKGMRQKELMLMMSCLESDVNWSWFFTFFLTNVISTVLTTAVSTLLYENSEVVYLLAFWFFSFLASTVFSMMIASFFSRASRAVVIGLLVYLIAVFVTIAIPINYREDDGTYVAIISLHPVAAFTYGLQEIGRLEDQGTGLQKSTVDYTDNPSGYTFTATINSLVLDSIIWGIATWYFNRVIKTDYGQAQPLWFPFLLSYWFPSRIASESLITENDATVDASIPVEPVDENLKRQARDGSNIELHHLGKTFGDKVAVEKLSLSFYSGEVSALLGSNGAGKTTTINMLTGAVAPTSGSATVQGKNIRTALPQIRKDMGVCLQHDCLFPELTVKEHLEFYSRLKGGYSKVLGSDAKQQVDQAIQDVGLLEKSDTLSRNLSGGMQRKLSLAIAFCGGSKVILLDEPTSGMDPFSRRFIWNIIRHYRQNRCIILTTHNMDEADTLGDRIAIMAGGQLRCAGSSLFLKRTFGVGYQLTIEKRKGEVSPHQASHNEQLIQPPHEASPVSPPDAQRQVIGYPPGAELGNAVVEPETRHEETLGVGERIAVESANEGCPKFSDISQSHVNDQDLQSIVMSAVDGSTLLSNAGSEMRFQLPMGSSGSFPPMLSRLDRLVDEGLISCFGVSITTLEDVVLLLARGEIVDKTVDSQRTSESHKAAPEESKLYSRAEIEQDHLLSRHLVALLKKRAGYFRRDKKAWICTTILPSVFVTIGFLVFTFAATDPDLSPLVLDLNDYNVKTPEPRNPILFNSPGGTFPCQPGNCVSRNPVVNEFETSEMYYFCGTRGAMQGNPQCTIQESLDIAGRFLVSGAAPQSVDVEDVRESSEVLVSYSNRYAATQYGAILFTYDTESQMFDGNRSVPYNDAVFEACLSRPSNYSIPCERFKGVGYIIQYNYTAPHISPLYQTLADEALVRHANDVDDFHIRCTIAPLPVTDVEKGLSKSDVAIAAWFLVVLAFPFVNSVFASFVVTERESKAKHLQTVAGVRPWAYWLSTFCWDVFNYQIPLWLTIFLMFVFDVDLLTTMEKGVLPGVIALLFLFGPASAGFTYCISYFFTNANVANMFVIVFGFLIGIGGPTTCTILTILGNDPLRDSGHLASVSKVLTWVLRCFPPFCLGNGLFRAISIDFYLYLEGNLGGTAWSETILLYEVIYLAAQSVIFLLLAVQLDKWSATPWIMSFWQRCSFATFRRHLAWGKQSSNAMLTFFDAEDDDVWEEMRRVLSGEAEDDLIVVQQLSKVYENGTIAVKEVTFGIPPGECFGLLGTNGAGKTTTIGMLTAEFPPTSGDAILSGFSVTNQPEKTRHCTGFCPQFDAHFANLTGREHVELYASIKGVPKNLVKRAAEIKLEEVGLVASDWDRLCAQYSGGMKRRLSLACATVARPRIVFLDECSTGVDPVARREIWEMITNMIAGEDVAHEDRTSVILTTHSMEECEALCSRIGIMASGRLRCLGSAQHLKSKFGQGYQVEMKVRVVSKADDDFEANKIALARMRVDSADEEGETLAEDVFFNLDETLSALRCLTGDDSLSHLITEMDTGAGYNVWRDASSSTGVDLDTLTAFVTGEFRMKQLDEFMVEHYPNHSIWERQDSKCRYEVNAVGVRISNIFADVEANREKLRLAGYGVSQTSLEQVFNFHAAQATLADLVERNQRNWKSERILI